MTLAQSREAAKFLWLFLRGVAALRLVQKRVNYSLEAMKEVRVHQMFLQNY
jgi:hypothetical protein